MDFNSLSQATLAKLEQLCADTGIVARMLRLGSRKADILSSFGETGEVALLPILVEYMLDTDSDVSEAARTSASQLLTTVPLESYVDLDVQLRTNTGAWSRWKIHTESIRPNEVLAMNAPCEIATLGLISMHSSGYVREAAVRRLAEREDGAELPFLLVRLNDWVGVVRDAARGAVAVRMLPAYARAFVENLALLLRVHRGGRGDHGWLFEAVVKILSCSESAEALVAGLHFEDMKVRTACMRFAVLGNSKVAPEALRAALSDENPMSRLWAAKHLLASVGGTEMDLLCAELLTDPFMPVRREGYSALVAREDAWAREKLEEALMDRHGSIRELARFYLRDRIDAAAFYRERISLGGGRKQVSAILGLGECGKAEDAAVVLPFLEDDAVPLRKAAVTAIGRLAPESMCELLVKSLADWSSGVSAAAAMALRPYPGRVADLIKSYVKYHARAHVRRRAFMLVCRLSKWDQLPVILATCDDTSEAIASEAKEAVWRWLRRYNRSYIAPSAEQLAEAIKEFHANRDHLSWGNSHEVEALLAEWSRD